MGHRYHNDVVVMYHLDFDYLQHQLGVVIHALRIKICPCTRECDILRLVDPLLINTVIAIEDLSIATVKKKPSIHPRFVVIVSLEELTVDLLVQELATVELHSV